MRKLFDHHASRGLDLVDRSGLASQALARQPWLDHALPSSLSYVGNVLVLLFILISFVAAVYFSTAQVVRAFAQNWDQFEKGYQSVTQWGEKWGLTLGGEQGPRLTIACDDSA